MASRGGQATQDYHERLRRIRARYPRAYERWSDEEDAFLGRLFDAEVSVGALADELGRHPGAIRSRLRRLATLNSAPVEAKCQRVVNPEVPPDPSEAFLLPLPGGSFADLTDFDAYFDAYDEPAPPDASEPRAERRQLAETVKAINRFLAQLYLKPCRLSDLLRMNEFSNVEIERIRSGYMQEFVDALLVRWGAQLPHVLCSQRYPADHPRTLRFAHVLRRNFGLSGGDPLTLAELGSELGLSRERVRQIRNSAIKLLRRGQRRAQVERILAQVASSVLGSAD